MSADASNYDQARNQLGMPGGAKCLPKGTKIF